MRRPGFLHVFSVHALKFHNVSAGPGHWESWEIHEINDRDGDVLEKMGKSRMIMNGWFSIATFDYQKVIQSKDCHAVNLCKEP